jgi:type IV pilus assembly protein PilB
MTVNISEDLFKTLLKLNLLDPKKLTDCYREANNSGKTLQEILFEHDLLNDENLGKIVADLYKLPYVRLSKIVINPQTLRIIPEVVAKNQKIISFEKDAGSLKLATCQPENTQIQEFIAKKTDDKVLIYYATQRDIEETLKNYGGTLQKSFDELLQNEVKSATEGTSPEAPVAKIVDLLIEYAYDNKASDIHIEPSGDNTLIRFRIDGILHDVLKISSKIHSRIITRLKILAKLRVDEHLSAQDGKLQQQLEEENLDVRISIVPTVDGEKAVLRLLSSRSRQFSLSDLGLSPSDLAKIQNNYKKPFGMILATGPTGSGKTSTIYSILKLLNSREKNIATIEDPVEYEIAGINQIQVNIKTNLTFASGLKTILRQDPDIIFVGEIRDEETAAIAINSALTGHLVLSTIHTNNAATTLPRLIDMKIEPFLVSSTVNLIIAQRLVRKICEKCRISKKMTLEELLAFIPEDIVTKIFDTKKEFDFYQGKGCKVCHDMGYLGRIGIFEVLEMSEEIKHLISQKADSGVIEKQAIAEGMTTMLEDALKKAEQGIVTLEEAIRATNEI